MKQIISIALLTIASIVTWAQDFTGTVLDKETKQPIAFAQVYLADLKTGTTTNEHGVFKLKNINQKNIRIQIAFVGYNLIDELVRVDSIKAKTFYLEQGYFNLEEVVVSAPTGRFQHENIVNISHRKITDLQQTSPLTLAEAISNIPGVEQITTGPGIGKPVIRGLSGNRIVTYAQGVRIENQQWGDEHGLGVGDVGIESVEVIKGPASLLYGSDALGGVLYFIDERYANHNTIEAFAQTKFLSNSLGSINNVGFKINKGKLKFNLFGAYSSHADYQLSNFERVYNTRFDEKNIKSSLGFSTKNWISNIRYSYLHNNFGIVKDPHSSHGHGGHGHDHHSNRKITLPFQAIGDHTVSMENIIYTGDSKIDFNIGYTNNNRKEFKEDNVIPEIGLKLNTFTYNLKWYSPIIKNRYDFIIGSQGMAQTNINNGEEILIPNAITTDFGIFAIANANFNKLQLQGGIRSDYRRIETQEMSTNDGHGHGHGAASFFPALNTSYNGLTFSSGAVYTINKTTVRANISSGFRAPNTSELLSDGVHHGTHRYMEGNNTLTNENATQLDLTIEYQGDHFGFSINPFYNAIQNYIYLAPTGTEINHYPVFEYLQTNAFLYGGELGVHYHPHKIHWLHLESNLSTVFAEDRNGNPLPLIPQVNMSSTINAEIASSGKVQVKNVFINHVYRFDQNRTSVFETSTSGFNVINIGLNLEIETKNKPIEITAGINNVLNANYIDHISRLRVLEIPNPGINFHVGIKVRIDKKL